MKVLLLGTSPSPLRPVLEAAGCEVIETAERIDADSVGKGGFDFIVSYRYRHIVRKDVIDRMQGKIINLHISLLPWNRGADPNLWSFLEDTPKGCTIHYIDEGLDTGDIIAQQEIKFESGEHTLGSTYASLNDALLRLFASEWPRIARGASERTQQVPGGTSHRSKDKKAFEHLLEAKGWDTAVEALKGKAAALKSKSVEP